MARTRGPGASHEQRRADILTAVRRVAAEQGITAVSQAAVAARAGVSPGRVQHYFPSKDALLTSAFEQLNEESSARIRQRVGAELDAAEPRAVLEAVLTELVPYDEASRAHVQFRQAYTAIALHHDGVADRLRERYRHLHGTDLAGLIRRDQAAGRIPAGVDALSAAIGLAALAEGLAYYVLIGITGPDTARERLLTAIAALYP